MDYIIRSLVENTRVELVTSSPKAFGACKHSDIFVNQPFNVSAAFFLFNFQLSFMGVLS